MNNDEMEQMMLERKIVSYHAAGFPPSSIDEKLALDPGTAHDVMCEVWRRDKNARTRRA